MKKRQILIAITFALTSSFQSQAGLFKHHHTYYEPGTNPFGNLRCALFGPSFAYDGDCSKEQMAEYNHKKALKAKEEKERLYKERKYRDQKKYIDFQHFGDKRYNRLYKDLDEFKTAFTEYDLSRLIIYELNHHLKEAVYYGYFPREFIKDEKIYIYQVGNVFDKTLIEVSLEDLYENYAWEDIDGKLHPFGIHKISYEYDWKVFNEAKEQNRPFINNGEFSKTLAEYGQYATLWHMDEHQHAIPYGACFLGKDTVWETHLYLIPAKSTEDCKVYDSDKEHFIKKDLQKITLYDLYQNYQWQDQDGKLHIFGIKTS